MEIVLDKEAAKYQATLKLSKQLRERIFKATRHNDHECLRQQLDEAHFADILNKYKETPLNIISRKIKTKDDIETVKILLGNTADLLWPDVDNVTPAKYLLLTKDSSLIDLVLMNLIDVQAPLDLGKNTALHIAIEAGDGPTVSKLLEFRANPNIKNSKGLSPIHVAVLNSRHHFLKDMIDHGGDIDIKGPRSLTPLHIAARMRSLESLLAVLAFKPKTDVLNEDQLTPLMELVTLYYSPPVRLIYELLEHGANPGFTKINGYNCLHLWVDRKLVNKHVNVFNYLLRLFIQYGLDINAVTFENETALHIAIRKCEYLMVMSLLRYGSDLEVRAIDGMALDMAIYRCNLEILLCIIAHIALQSSELQEYAAHDYGAYVTDELSMVFIQCREQIENFKFNYIRDTNLSIYDIITMSTEDISWRLPSCEAMKNLDFGIDYLWIFRIMAYFKLEDGQKCRWAYKCISLFLGNLFYKIFKKVESAKILYTLLVPYFKYHEALKLRRRLEGVLERE